MTCKLLFLTLSLVITLLMQLILCQRIDAERINHLQQQKHQLRRRNIIKFGDERFLDFHFTKEPNDVIISPNSKSSVIFNCQYDFSRKEQSDVRIEWRKDGISVSSIRSIGRILIVSNGSLLIENPVETDEGFYQCAVFVIPRLEPRFTWTILSRKAQLRIPSLKSFHIEPESRTIRLHQPVGFQCVLDPLFPGQVEWYKDDRRIYEGDNGYHILPISQSLEIKSTEIKHQGEYKCVIRDSGVIKQSKEAQLKVVNFINENFSIEFILKPKKQQSSNYGDDIILECLVNGSPKPRIRWLRDSIPIIEDGRIQFVGVEKSSLLIRKLQVYDSGIYTCRAENGNDSVDSSTTLIVKVPPRIGKAPLDRITQETADVEFDCSAEQAVPQAGITWYKNGEKIIQSEYFVIEKEKLKILGLVRDDQGIYQCIVNNDVGSAQASAQLIVDPAATHLALTSAAASTGIPQVPTEPLGLKVTNLASRVVSLKWDKPLQTHGEIMNYHVFFRDEESSRERTVTTPKTIATIGDLRPSTVYVIRISAENRVGLGKSTGEFKITTAPEQATPSKVRNLRANVLTSESVEVLWDPPKNNVDDSLRYKLYYIRKDLKSVEEETQVHMVKTSYVLHDLDKDSEYSIRVEAESSNGASPSSDPINVRTFTDIPSGPPTNIRAEALESGSIRVSWQQPSIGERNGPITGYKIKFKIRRRGSKGSIVVVDGDPGSYTLNGLESGTPYTIRMAAINHNGTGPFTEWIEVETLLDDLQDTLISAPRSLRVEATHDSLFLTWDPPLAEGVIVRGYEIGWGPGVPDQEKVRVDAHVRSYTIKGLKPSREYVVALRGVNNAGPGFPIYETKRTSAYGISTGFGSNKNPHVPTATPLGVRAESESSSSIRISWTDPNDVFNPLYTVKYSSLSDNHGAKRYVNTSENEITVTDLRPNTQYEFSVKLVDSPHWSMTVANRTQPAPPSSPPRDLTVVPPSKSRYVDPNSVTLTWQPPKYANGEISDYSVLYTSRPEQDDKDWLVDSVRGDQLSMTINGLIPQTVYYFKIQARNVRGIGPFSPMIKYEPDGLHLSNSGRTKAKKSDINNIYEKIILLWETNPLYIVIGIGIISFVLLLFAILLTIICLQRNKKSPRQTMNKGYIQGRKQSTQDQRDYWIPGNPRQYEGTVMHDLKHHDVPVDSPPPRYQVISPLDDLMSQSQPSPASLMLDSRPMKHSMKKLHRQSLPPSLAQSTKKVHVVYEPSYSTTEDNDSAIVTSSRTSSTIHFNNPPMIMNAKKTTIGLLHKRQNSNTPTLLPPGISRESSNGIQGGSSAYVSDAESNGTISRSYHHSSTSLEARQRTPQIVYTGNNRQPITKIDFNSDHASSYGGSSTALQVQNQTPPPTGDYRDYRTLRGSGNSNSSNPLKSFTQLANGPPPLSPSHGGQSATLINNHGETRTAQIVRPTVFNPSTRGSPLNTAKPFMGSQKQLKQVGRATVQPRVNISDRFSPYASTRDVTNDDVVDDYPHPMESDNRKLQEASSIESLPLEGLNDMVQQLKELQQDFQFS